MSFELNQPPRRLILQAGLAVSSVALVTPATAEDKQRKAKHAGQPKMADVTPPEDLMREHGVLDRVLLIYEAAMRKFASNADSTPR